MHAGCRKGKEFKRSPALVGPINTVRKIPKISAISRLWRALQFPAKESVIDNLQPSQTYTCPQKVDQRKQQKQTRPAEMIHDITEPGQNGAAQENERETEKAEKEKDGCRVFRRPVGIEHPDRGHSRGKSQNCSQHKENRENGQESPGLFTGYLLPGRIPLFLADSVHPEPSLNQKDPESCEKFRIASSRPNRLTFFFMRLLRHGMKHSSGFSCRRVKLSR